MKKYILIFGLLLLCMSAKAQVVIPNYGATSDGKIFLKESAVDELCTAGNSIDLSGNWTGKATWVTWTSAPLMDYKGSGVYVLETGLKLKGSVIVCFKLNEQCYFPSAALDQGKSALFINGNDVISNGQTPPGFNLKIPVTDSPFSP